MNNEENYEIEWYNSHQNKAKLDVSDMGLGTLSELIDAGFIDLSPDFQRRKRWDDEKKSMLVDSFMRNIPVPPVYLAEDVSKRGTYAVIDGKQRLTAISEYLTNKLQLIASLDSPFAGKRYDQLPKTVQISLKMKTLRITTLLYGSDLEIVHNVFVRLNKGGQRLTAQELRNVEFSGALNRRLIDLSCNSFLRRQFRINDTSERFKKMQDVEMVLRFLTLAEHYLNPDACALSANIRLPRGLGGAMDDFMEKYRRASRADLDRFSKLFSDSISAVESIWGEEAFKAPDRDQSRWPMYDAEMIAVATYVSAGIDISGLRQRRNDILTATHSLFGDDAKFADSIAKGTNNATKITYRIEVVREMLREFL